MNVIDRNPIIETIQNVTIPVESYQDDILGIYQFIYHSIGESKEKLEKLETVDLIAVENIDREGDRLELHDIVLPKKEREILNIYIIGDFQQDYPITWELSEILADFYVEYLLLPIINNITYEEIQARPSHFQEQLKNAIRVYEARRIVHRNSAAISS